MPKDPKSKPQTSRKTRGTVADSYTEHSAVKINLIEIRPGLFLNADQIVSVRVLPQEENDSYAILQLSNGDKLALTSGEFSTITGKERRLPARLLQKSPMEKQ